MKKIKISATKRGLKKPSISTSSVVNKKSAATTAVKKKLTPAEKNKFSKFVKIGDILFTSWGYDMTINDFYQIVGYVGTSSVKVRHIRKIYTTGYDNARYSEVAGVKNAFDRPEKTVRLYVDDRRHNEIYTKIDNHWAYIWDGKPVYENHND